MATKVDSSSAVELRHVQSTVSVSASSTASASSTKVSKFGTKSGFVIPKNKLSGSLVPIFRGGGKVEAGNAVKEESAKQVQRKTKWGADLTLDAAVRKGRALAYQTRVEQITQQLKSGALEIGGDQDSQLPKQTWSRELTREKIDNEKLELLELEKRELIGEILRLNPSYKAPPDYKPLLKEATVPIPIKAYPGYNFVGLLLGPESNTQKRLEEETGAKVRVYGIKVDTQDKSEITQSDVAEAQTIYEELYVKVSADAYEKVDAAVSLIELLLTPVSGSSSLAPAIATSVAPENANMFYPSKNTTSGYMALSVADINQGIPQPMLVTAQAGLPQYQLNPAAWFTSAPPNVSSHPSSGFTPLSLPNNIVRFPPPPIGPYNVPPYSGQPPPFGSAPSTSSAVVSRPQLPMQAMQRPQNQHIPQNRPMPAQQPPSTYPMMPSQARSATPFTAAQPMPSGTMPASRPPMSANPQSVSMAPLGPLPNRPLATAPSGSSGWSTATPAVLLTQRPTQFAPASAPPMRPQPVHIPAANAPQPSTPTLPSNMANRPPTVSIPVPSQPRMLANVANRPPASNFAPAATFPSQPPNTTPAFPALRPQIGPVPTPNAISSSGTPLRAPMPGSMPIPLSMPLPAPGSSFVPVAPALAPTLMARPQTAALLSASAPVLAQSPASSQSSASATSRPTPRPAQSVGPSSQSPGAASIPNSGIMPSFSPVHPPNTISTSPNITALKPPRPLSGDFTFQPLRAQVPASPNTPGPNNQSASQTGTPLTVPQAPSFRPAMQNPPPSIGAQGFPSPVAVRATGPSQISIPLSPSSAVSFSANQNVVQTPLRFPTFQNANPVPPITPTSQVGPPSFSPVPQGPNLPGHMPARPVHMMPPRQNQLLPTIRPSGLMIPNQQVGGKLPGHAVGKNSPSPGAGQIYDPFSPTSISSAPTEQGDEPMKMRKQETDAEYEDLMASVGVK